MKHGIAPHEQEQIAFTVGAAKQIEAELPTVYSLTLTLHLSGGKKLSTQKIAYMNTWGAEYALRAARDKVAGNGGLISEDCIRDEHKKIQKILKESRPASPELREFQAEMADLAKSL